jgi:hypothetical protein
LSSGETGYIVFLETPLLSQETMLLPDNVIPDEVLLE